MTATRVGNPLVLATFLSVFSTMQGEKIAHSFEEQLLPTVLGMSLKKVTLLCSNLASVTDLKLHTVYAVI